MKNIKSIDNNENKTKRLPRLISIGASVGTVLGAAIIAFAISSKISQDSTRLPNSGGVVEFKIDIGDLNDYGIEVVPGSEQSISTSVKNDSGENMYMFVRLGFGNYTSEDGTEQPLYSFTPSDDWAVVENEDAGQIVLAYTSGEDELAVVEAQDSVELSGTLICLVTKREFSQVDNFSVDFTGIGISTEDGITDPGRAYRNSVSER